MPLLTLQLYYILFLILHKKYLLKTRITIYIYILGCVALGSSRWRRVRFLGWCNSVSAARLWEPRIAFPYSDTTPSTAPIRIKQAKLISYLNTRHVNNPLTYLPKSPVYLLCSHGITLEEKLCKFCVLFGCVARAAIPWGKNIHEHPVTVWNTQDLQLKITTQLFPTAQRGPRFKWTMSHLWKLYQ